MFTFKGTREAAEVLHVKIKARAPIVEREGVALFACSFPRSKRKKVPGATPLTATPLRPYDRGGPNDRSKAIAYARWLAARDGVHLPAHSAIEVVFGCVYLHGYKQPVTRAHSVRFGDAVIINIPHYNYDPTLPCEDRGDSGAALLIAAE